VEGGAPGVEDGGGSVDDIFEDGWLFLWAGDCCCDLWNMELATFAFGWSAL
jgi:hypothetical protein